jgi:hypothetical protein
MDEIDNQNDLSLERINSTLDQVVIEMRESKRRHELRNFKGTGMKLVFAKNEIQRYFNLGLDKSDIACIVASWGLSTKDFEEANEYIHIVLKPNTKSQEGIIL